MTVYAITDTKTGEQGLRLLIFKLPNPLMGTLIPQSNGVLYSRGWAVTFGTAMRAILVVRL